MADRKLVIPDDVEDDWRLLKRLSKVKSSRKSKRQGIFEDSINSEDESDNSVKVLNDSAPPFESREKEGRLKDDTSETGETESSHEMEEDRSHSALHTASERDVRSPAEALQNDIERVTKQSTQSQTTETIVDIALGKNIGRNLSNQEDLKEYTQCCWGCRVTLKLSEGYCWYETHAHPKLDIPVCVLCRDELESPEEDACVGCGAVPETCWLCDDCDADWCSNCIAQLHSPTPNAEDPWSCPACSPSLSLQEVQLSNKVNDTSPQRELEDVLEELQMVLQQEDECLDQNPDEKRQAILQELSGTLQGKPLQEAVDAELESWNYEWQRHYWRLSSTISSLHDEIDLELPQVYKLLGRKPRVPETMPSWALEATATLNARPTQPLPRYSPPPDNYQDVEELLPVSTAMKQPQSSSLSRLEAQSRKVEDEILQSEAITVRREDDDAQLDKLDRDLIVAGQRIRRKQQVSTGCPGQTSTAKSQPSSTGAKAMFEIEAFPRKDLVSNLTGSPRKPMIPKKPSLAILPRFTQAVISTFASPRKKKAQSSVNDIFEDSSLTLHPGISVACPLADKLKHHQRQGVQFLWEKCFGDLVDDRVNAGGGLLAHSMGLGKSLTTIATIHTILTHPILEGKLSTVLLVVPVNTLHNWEQEFHKWIGKINPGICVFNMKDMKDNRIRMVGFWRQNGGVLLVSDKSLARLIRDVTAEALQPDIVIMDEIHTMLSKKNTKIAGALQGLKTRRRIGLSGSPLQNQLTEYFNILNYLQPGLFGYDTESKFDSEYEKPIQTGMRADSSQFQRSESEHLSGQFASIADPFVHRKDATELSKDLPSMQQVVLHTRQSRMQVKLYRAFEKLNQNNFFKKFTALRPIHNHPKCLLMGQGEKNKNDPAGVVESDPDWWRKVAPTAEELEDVSHGYKVVLLLHILACAQRLDEKVLIFSQCLRTLNLLETVLAKAWQELVPSIADEFPNQSLGRWTKNKDYLRIDGSTSSQDRGNMVMTFNTAERNPFRAFLISVRAGGIGINLPAASRVVLLDTHFNPTVTNQAIWRAYRYGQTREVFVYRMLTEGTIEEKVYSRSVQKTGMAMKIIDQKSINRSFTSKELADLQSTLQWVQCDSCEKWRLQIGVENDEELPDKWYCRMNITDPRHNSCDAPERNQRWYEQNCLDQEAQCGDESKLERNLTEKDEELEQKDEILRHLLRVTMKGKQKPLISRHYFHDSLLRSTNTENVDQLVVSPPEKATYQDTGVSNTLEARIDEQDVGLAGTSTIETASTVKQEKEGLPPIDISDVRGRSQAEAKSGTPGRRAKRQKDPASSSSGRSPKKLKQLALSQSTVSEKGRAEVIDLCDSD